MIKPSSIKLTKSFTETKFLFSFKFELIENFFLFLTTFKQKLFTDSLNILFESFVNFFEYQKY